MKKFDGWKWAGSLFLLFAVAAIAPAQTFTSLLNFDGPNGYSPINMSLVQGPDGALYGTTGNGGDPSCGNSLGCGTVFRLGPHGLTTIYSFCSQPNCSDGGYPAAPLVLASNGSFYGTTSGGGSAFCGESIGCGTVFKITPGGTLTTLYTFNTFASGYTPSGGLVQSVAGDLFGTTELGGMSPCDGSFGCGTVFRISQRGSFTTLDEFTGTDGAFPFGNLVQGTDGDFYGTTNGFPLSVGTIFRMNAVGVLTSLPLGPTDVAYPFAGLIQATDGNFYGTSEDGGDHKQGAVFKVDSTTGVVTVLYSFCGQAKCADGSHPQTPLIQGTDGNLYGTTRYGGDTTCNASGCGTVFQITPAGVLTTLHAFTNTDGSSPLDGLLQATNGVFYGATPQGGDLHCSPPSGCGTLFSLDMGLGPFVAFVQPAGKAAATAGILGQGFTGATNVSFNGTSASFTVVADTFLKATIPPGATTGYVTVTTPSGTLTSNVPFRVIP